MKPLPRGLRRALALIIGIVFFAAGSMKLIDPVGSQLLVYEYLKFFHIGFLSFLALPLGIAFPLIETLAGAALITGIAKRLTSIVTSILIVFFTLVTLLLLIFNPSMDCGCFGEAVHLTHAQSFIKNLVLCALGFAAFSPLTDEPAKKFKKLAFGLTACGVIFLCVYSIIYIPCIDFTSFDLNARLRAEIDEQIDDDPMVVTFIYEKNGKEGAFTINKLPDSTWTFVRTETEYPKGEEKTSDNDIVELPIRDANGNDRDSLAAKESVIVFSAYQPAKLSPERWEKLGMAMTNAGNAGFTPILLLAASPADFESLVPKGLDTAFRMKILTGAYSSDYKTLISLNRSNGGATYFNDGDLIEKWSRANYPTLHEFQKLYNSNYTDIRIRVSTKGRMTFQAYMLYSFAVMLLM